MAMNVRNNLATTYSLSQFNSHNEKLNKSLTQISSGQKLNSYGDNSADYSISERMRVQIRSLRQNAHNVQNGSSMLQTALAGAQNIVDLLREMKKVAIESADDSTSYEDRKVLQKELQQRLETINDIALGTEYNGKRLLDGTYNMISFSLKGVPTWSEPKQFKMTPGKIYTKTVNADGSRVIVGKNRLEGIASAFKAKDSSISQLNNPMSARGFQLRHRLQRRKIQLELGGRISSVELHRRDQNRLLRRHQNQTVNAAPSHQSNDALLRRNGQKRHGGLRRGD